MITTQTMITLVIHYKKRKEATKELQKFIKTNELQGATILTHGERTHFHLLCKRDKISIDTNNWPGRARKDTVTEPQANWMKETHEQCII